MPKKLKRTKEFEEFCDEILHAIVLGHDTRAARIYKKRSCGYCGTEDCSCNGYSEECDCNLCQAVYEIETKQTDGEISYKNYSHVFESFLEFPTFGYSDDNYNTATDWEEFKDQIHSHILFLNEIKGILSRHLKNRVIP